MIDVPNTLALHEVAADGHPNQLVDRINESQSGSLPGLLDFRWLNAGRGHISGRFEISAKHFSPHGLLHGASIVALADTACGFGCLASLPEGAIGFATGELKTNFIGAAREGGVSCDARLVHAGRTTQVWDAEIRSESTGKTIALFRCTQMLLYPPAKAGGRAPQGERS
ncbi:PaaI family thioesterase [Bradyrhizobium viridifuturi]|jgi:1,4-dihydroxy-2-naphthoyl-CoA hydrolase|nr:MULTISPECIES: PaaI family thioesterase [Bradyrhizobium]ERF82596.1 MAG: spermidine/putrescine transport system ATP-binding protein [Bradyrhizobium sp. DFCI-1]OYU60807.1 MAG: competence protein ComA [Bradyrhizobium sp. PARBB1]PSO24936.1 PaaI family thioesterase [Bradyrhizobium sp. MOS004]QRI67002.1 PaaI family thioesterase [Bradyrhizobium sp. PSBB068]MBR1019641.1 PaaI family thioesterase [Bradyrhizobium viridifuturi]